MHKVAVDPGKTMNLFFISLILKEQTLLLCPHAPFTIAIPGATHWFCGEDGRLITQAMCGMYALTIQIQSIR